MPNATTNLQLSSTAGLSTNINVGMDEVVAVFVAKYETELFKQKGILAKSIRDEKGEIKKLETEVTNIDKTKYEMVVEQLEIHSKVNSVVCDWTHNVVEVTTGVYAKGTKYCKHDVITKLPIAQIDIDQHMSDVAELGELTSKLEEILGLIKSVSRKERQIRGRISEMKLNEAGMSNLLNETGIMDLIKLS